MFVLKDIFSVSLILFSVIDIIGSVPVVIDLRKKQGKIHSGRATIISGILMIAFLFLGQSILSLFGLDIGSFAVAGAIVMFIIAMEMILGITLFKNEGSSKSGSIVPLAFPLIAGAGTLTTILSVISVYDTQKVIVGIIVILLFVYLVLKSTNWLERKLGESGFDVLRRVFGIILLAISVKIFKTHIGLI